ncbi:glutamyl-tRNA reductase [Roseospira marina]|uniref:Glutamyl-tRNA reductase n=2 Tax=Roseospira marina TaxID=140057 RepID=A0A5M6IE46_9PROT|nr:glutamyl-tRNA reductase [Roseospira marina]
MVVVGVNHHTSSMALRDQVALEDDAIPGFLGRLRANGLTQALVLSTCDRVEIICVAANADVAETTAEVALWILAEKGHVSPCALRAACYVLRGGDAVRHAFAVASSLDSQVIGEPHVLRQVKAGYAAARAAGLVGAELERVMQSAFACAKRVRSETRIAEGPVSVASAAVQVARDLHGDLDGCSALLLGTGEMGELLAEAFQAHGLDRLIVRARRRFRAEAVARRLGAHVSAHEALIDDIVAADIIICCTGGREHIVGVDTARQAAKRRRQRPVFIADVAVPGDVEPAVNTVDNAFLYDLNDLEGVAMQGRAHREGEAEAAWRIVREEVCRFQKGRIERAAAPVITLLHARFEAERARALAEAHGDADKATRLLVGRLLHTPSEELRRLAVGPTENLRHAENVTRRLFRLTEADATGASDDGAPRDTGGTGGSSAPP